MSMAASGQTKHNLEVTFYTILIQCCLANFEIKSKIFDSFLLNHHLSNRCFKFSKNIKCTV